MRLREAVVGLALLTTAACGGGNSASPRELLPDLDQVAPDGLSIAVRGGRERLIFLSSVENVGAGPLLVAGRRPSTTEPEMAATQLIRSTGGPTRTHSLAARLRFVVSETHRHWHLLGFEAYELRSPARRSLGRDHKTGFCLGDRYDAHASSRIPGEPPAAVWTQECGRGDRGRLRILEGLSPGFGDDYVPLLEGQFIDVTGLAPGRYVLVHRTNSNRDLLESNYANNAASVLLSLTRDASGRAGVRVLATCPDSATCS